MSSSAEVHALSLCVEAIVVAAAAAEVKAFAVLQFIHVVVLHLRTLLAVASSGICWLVTFSWAVRVLVLRLEDGPRPGLVFAHGMLRGTVLLHTLAEFRGLFNATLLTHSDARGVRRTDGALAGVHLQVDAIVFARLSRLEAVGVAFADVVAHVTALPDVGAGIEVPRIDGSAAVARAGQDLALPRDVPGVLPRQTRPADGTDRGREVSSDRREQGFGLLVDRDEDSCSWLCCCGCLFHKIDKKRIQRRFRRWRCCRGLLAQNVWLPSCCCWLPK